MDDARTVIRYVLPGLVGVIMAIGILMANGRMPDVLKITDLGDVFGAVIFAGGYGYFASLVYHWFHWSFLGFPINHGPAIEMVSSNESAPSGKESRNSRYRTWIDFTVAWIQLRSDGIKGIEIATQRSEHYADRTHGAGTAFIAAAIASLTSLIMIVMSNGLTLFPTDDCRSLIIDRSRAFYGTCSIASLILWVLWLNHKRLCRITEDVLNKCFPFYYGDAGEEKPEAMGESSEQPNPVIEDTGKIPRIWFYNLFRSQNIIDWILGAVILLSIIGIVCVSIICG